MTISSSLTMGRVWFVVCAFIFTQTVLCEDFGDGNKVTPAPITPAPAARKEAVHCPQLCKLPNGCTPVQPKDQHIGEEVGTGNVQKYL